MIPTRILGGALVVIAILLVVFIGEPWYSIAITIWGAGALYELYTMFAHGGFRPESFAGIGILVLIMAAAFFRATPAITEALVVAAVVVPLVCVLIRRDRTVALGSWALTVAGVLYIGWLIRYFVLLRQIPEVSTGSGLLLLGNFLPDSLISRGLAWVLVVFFATWLTDVGAFVVGSAIGRHKMAPLISPNKTWEGALGGLLLGTVTTVVFASILRPGTPYWHLVALGLLVAVAAQIGDLAESLLKRQTQVKDTSQIIPGHGGLLDRLDSLLFTVVVVYYFVTWASI
ncbi:MAG: phosphatidate cytidylyltransferase [Chloroflexi bacterium]|nr:phosphatidate cytidylyltransferase [Chloroflexota bacterium]